MDWIQEVLEAEGVKDATSATVFKEWACICAVSAVVRKSVWLPKKKVYNLYPNLYCLIIADSGSGKSFPIMMAKKMVTEVNNTRVISGQNSIQGVIKTVSKAFTIEGGGAPLIDAHAFLISGEFCNLLLEDTSSLGLMTELYNTHENEPHWIKTLAGEDSERKLKNPCWTMFAGTNEPQFHKVVGPVDVEGGFVARTILCINNERSHIDPLIDDVAENDPGIDWKKLSEHLKMVARIEGPFRWHPMAREHYRAWHEAWFNKAFMDPTGTVKRVHDTILKVAMCRALTRHYDRTIELPDLEWAMERTLPLVGNAKKLMAGSGRSDIALQMRMVVEDLICHPPDHMRTRAQILSKFHGHMESGVLDRVIQTLEDAGILTAMKARGKVYYKLTEKFLGNYRKGVEEDEG